MSPCSPALVSAARRLARTLGPIAPGAHALTCGAGRKDAARIAAAAAEALPAAGPHAAVVAKLLAAATAETPAPLPRAVDAEAVRHARIGRALEQLAAQS
jgi:hypothetical protein